MSLFLVLQLFVSHISVHDRAVGRFSELKLWGNWQSCRDDQGEYGERAFPYIISGNHRWSLHLGPFDEFALYRGEGPEGPHDHSDKGNLLGSSYHYYAFKSRTGQNWTIPSLKLRINVISVPTSLEVCEGFEIKIEEMK